jgi:excisionase family DNA binding protein
MQSRSTLEASKTKRRARGVQRGPISPTVDETCRITGLGRAKVYELIGEGKLKSVAVGRRRLVLVESIEVLLQPHPIWPTTATQRTSRRWPLA